jgi:hypothetical protein
MFSRIRQLAAVLVIAVVAFFVLPRVQSQPVHAAASSAVAVHQTVPHLPSAPAQHVPFQSLALSAILGATAKKKATTRKAAGKKRDMPMYLDSDVHVMREDPNNEKRMITTIVRGGRMLDDLDDEALTDDEIDELTARRVIRPATVEEVDRAAQQDKAAQRADLVGDQTTEIQQLRANREGERAGLVAQGSAPADLISFDQATTEQVAALQGKHADALAALDAQ